MIIINDIIIPIPKSKVYKAQIVLNGTDVTSKVYESEWTKPTTIGIGIFKLTLINVGGLYSGTFQKGNTALFYCDNSAGGTRLFYGRIDYVKERIEEGGQFLDIEGRHRCKNVTEVNVCYEAEADHGTILNAIIDANLTGFTHNNVVLTGSTIKVRWTYKPFWECVKELCEDSRSDCYVDDDLDFHFFRENSIINDECCIADDNNIKNEDIGTDDYNEKSRVTVIGQDDEGLPIVYTAISSTEVAGDIREVFIKDTNARTMAQVKDIADGKLSELINRPVQGKYNTFLLHEVSPGDNILIILPRQKIYSYFKVLKYTHKYGTKVGPPQTILYVEKEINSTETILKQRVIKEVQLQEADNINKLRYSLNLPFDDGSQNYSITDLIIEGGVLKLASGKTTGTFISTSQTALSTITLVELRNVGVDLTASIFETTCNDRNTFFAVTKDTLTSVSSGNQGSKIAVRITLNSNSTNPNPQVNSAVLLYS